MLRHAIYRAIPFAAVWWILTDGEPESWSIGLPTVFISAWISMSLTNQHPGRWRLLSAVRFIGFFAIASVRGGIDVARRAFHPRMPLHPDLIRYPFKIENPSARILMANTISLLPGTLSVELHDDDIEVHILDNTQPFRAELERVESVIDALFRQH